MGTVCLFYAWTQHLRVSKQIIKIHWPPSPFPLLYVSPESVACPAAESVLTELPCHFVARGFCAVLYRPTHHQPVILRHGGHVIIGIRTWSGLDPPSHVWCVKAPQLSEWSGWVESAMWSCDYTPLLFLLLMDQWLGGWAPSLVRPGSNPGCACRSVSVSLDNGGSFVLFLHTGPHPPSPCSMNLGWWRWWWL